MCVRVCGRCVVITLDFVLITVENLENAKVVKKDTDTQLRRNVVCKVFSLTEREPHRESRKVSAFPACFNLSSSLSLSQSLLLLPFLFVLSMHQSINWFTSITKATHFLVGPRLHKMSHKSPWRLLLLSAYCFVHQILS